MERSSKGYGGYQYPKAKTYNKFISKVEKVKVNRAQQKNPLLKKNRFEYTLHDHMVEDYLIGESTSVLYLQLKYHMKYPKYLMSRAEELLKKKKGNTKILILQVKENEDDMGYITDIQLDCMRWEIKLLLAWSQDECAKYIQIIRTYQNKGTSLLEENKKHKTQEDLAIDSLTSIKSITKRDAKTLLKNYGSIAEIIKADHDEFIPQNPTIIPKISIYIR